MDRCAEVEQILEQMYETFETGDFDAFERHIASGDETLVIGTDPNEWWHGSDDALRAMRAQLGELKDAGIKVSRGAPRGLREGPVAWASDQPAFMMPTGDTVPMRITAVFVEGSDGWKLVQWHGSVGAANEEVVGTELTT